MTVHALFFRLGGWAIGLGLISGQLSYYSDGQTSGAMVAAGVAVLVWWAIVTLGPLVISRWDPPR